jgi:hypothetical protein
MPDIGEDEVMAFWRDQMNNKEIKRQLRNLFKRSTTAGITKSRDNLPIQYELRDRFAECLTNQFGNEDFVILKYGSWIIDSLENPEQNEGVLDEGFLDFWLQNTRTNNVRDENGKYVFNYANPEQTMNARAKKFAEAHSWGAGRGREIIAAFSESKIWIGWKEDIPQKLLAGIVHTAGLTPSPCFSWWSIYPDNPPPSNCLAPWVKSQVWVKLKNPENTPALFRELIVRQNEDDYNFLEKSSWNPNLRL